MEFKPTYLYIKQHSVTGLKYFGKTTSDDPYSYFGSGKHWRYHINKHGKEYVVTLWCLKFYDKEHLEEFALTFSKNNNIVESKEWANLKAENGLDGGHNIYAIEKNKEKKGKSWCDIYTKEGLEIMENNIPNLIERGRKYQFQNIDRDIHKQICINGGKSHKGKKESKETCENISRGIRNSTKFYTIVCSQKFKDSISNSVHSIWKDENSIYNSPEYRNKLSKAQLNRSKKRLEDMKIKFNSIDGAVSSISDVCKELNISYPTAKKYIEILGLRFRL